jgi:hypothetical protein
VANLSPLTPANLCGDSNAPNVQPGYPCFSANQASCRETVFPSGTINAIDAPMPPALIRLALNGAGFIRPADKANIYLGNTNLFYDTHIPAEPWITPIMPDGEGYQWNTWGAGSKSGLSPFWTSLAGSGTEIVSCPGAPSAGCVGGVPTGGYDMIQIYSDNHGEAMAWLNGDANLDLSGCPSSAPTTVGGSQVVLPNALYCSDGTVVGTSTLTALANYPDNQNHYSLGSNNGALTWTWGGTQVVTTVTDPADPQSAWLVLHLADRDGFCGGSPSLHPVLGEQVDFLIGTGDGVITPDATGNATYGAPVALTDKMANVTAFDTAHTAASVLRQPLVAGECQAWVHVASSLPTAVGGVVELVTNSIAPSERSASDSPLSFGASVAVGLLMAGAVGLYVAKLRKG